MTAVYTPVTTSALDKCPFCGSFEVTCPDPEHPGDRGTCERCGAQGGEGSEGDVHGARNAWNMRADTAAEVTRLNGLLDGHEAVATKALKAVEAEQGYQKELATLVLKMLDAQQAYFKSRRPELLAASKDLERILRTEANAALGIGIDCKGQQGRLI